MTLFILFRCILLAMVNLEKSLVLLYVSIISGPSVSLWLDTVQSLVAEAMKFKMCSFLLLAFNLIPLLAKRHASFSK